jgi:hypothetical protein
MRPPPWVAVLRGKVAYTALAGLCNTVPHVWPATAWDASDWDGNNARGWTVVGRLRRKQAHNRAAKAAARRNQVRSDTTMGLMSAGHWEEQQRERRAANWTGGFTVLALLFAQPSAPAIRMLDERGDYFDIRTGETWDLFFPGYYRTPEDEYFEHQTGARRVWAGTSRTIGSSIPATSTCFAVKRTAKRSSRSRARAQVEGLLGAFAPRSGCV